MDTPLLSDDDVGRQLEIDAIPEGSRGGSKGEQCRRVTVLDDHVGKVGVGCEGKHSGLGGAGQRIDGQRG
jgi:hypothetical protein